jgi:hypothetical protein
VDDKDIRQAGYPCPLGAETGPQTIVVRQVIAEGENQLALDIPIAVPDPKPSIEQIVDVFVKDVEINSINVITDKIIVSGEFEIKAVYVADAPNNPVHAIEIKHFRWTQYVDLVGARRWMDGDASVSIEFVDYDVDEYTRAYKYKYEDMPDDECDSTPDDDCADDHHHHHHHACRDLHVSVVLKIAAKVIANREIQIGGIGTVPTMPTTPKG